MNIYLHSLASTDTFPFLLPKASGRVGKWVCGFPERLHVALLPPRDVLISNWVLKIRRIFVFSRHKDLVGGVFFGGAGSIMWVKDIGELIKRLDEDYDYKKRNPDVCILPDATIQLV